MAFLSWRSGRRTQLDFQIHPGVNERLEPKFMEVDGSSDVFFFSIGGFLGEPCLFFSGEPYSRPTAKMMKTSKKVGCFKLHRHNADNRNSGPKLWA